MPFRSPLSRRALTLVGLGCALLPAFSAHAADYPNRPVRVLVGYPPGGATDVIARLVTTQLSEKLGQPFVVENKPGAGSNIASEEVARAKPDGYTLLVSTIQNATNMSIYKTLRYNVGKDFAHVAQFMASPSVLVLAPTVPAKNLQEFLALAKAQPGKYSYASTGNGGSPHLAGEMLKSRTQVELLHVPYRGTAPALIDVSAGNVSASFMTTLGVLQHMQSGKVNPIAVAAPQRLADLPNVPTMAEAGLPQFEVLSWNGLSVPAGTPPEIVNQLNKAVNDALSSPELQSRIKALGGVAVVRTPADYSRYIQEEVGKWRTVVQTAKIEMD